MAGRIVIAEARCKGCQLCTTVCPKKLVSMAEHFNVLGYRPSRFEDGSVQCTGCMLCALVCPEVAITVYRSDAKSAGVGPQGGSICMPRQLMKGNEAIGEAAIRAGVEAYFGYPITPQTELLEYMARRMPEEGRVFLQAESELAAINMVYGAACTGARVMTSSSSPGVSLMQEGLSYIICSRIPAVLVDIVRGGPGLGNIQPSQSDYFQLVKGGGHGDYHPLVLAPASVQEAADLTVLSFDLAWKYRHVAIVVGDGMIGQMMEPCQLPDARPLRKERPDWAVSGAKGRPRRTITSLALNPEVLESINLEIQRVQRDICAHEVRYSEYSIDDADIVVVAYGMMGRIAQTAVKRARALGIRAGLLRPISLYPFPYERVGEITGRVKAFLVAEMSAGQMIEDVRLGVGRQVPVHFFGRMGGIVPVPEEILADIEQLARTIMTPARTTVV